MFFTYHQRNTILPNTNNFHNIKIGTRQPNIIHAFVDLFTSIRLLYNIIMCVIEILHGRIDCTQLFLRPAL